MLTTLNPTCPLCGLRYSDRPLLDLHIREDHRRRGDRPEPDPGDSGDTRTSPPRARGLFPLHSLPTELFPATRDVTAERHEVTAERHEVTAAPAAYQPPQAQTVTLRVADSGVPGPPLAQTTML